MAPQVSRLLLVFVALIALFFGARSQMAPKNFGATGFYPADAPAKIASRQISFAGKSECTDCHADIIKGSTHIPVSCETCHGPSKAHADDFDKGKHPFVPNSNDFCVRCHGFVTGRPVDFPQIEPKDHHPEATCISCHNVHPKEAS